MIRTMRGLAYVVVLATATAAGAHEVLHSIERGRAVAVKAYFPDGETLAYTSYEIYSPVDRKIPYQKGRTDRSGYLAFVPDVAGKWRVKVVDNTGHGFDTEIDVASVAAAADHGAAGAPALSGAAFVLRPLVGLAVIGAVFAGLFAFYRRKGHTQCY